MRRSDTLMKVISVLFLIAIVCYIGLHLLDSLINPLVTAPAVYCTFEESGKAEGYAVRDESPLYAFGVVSTELADGEHVSYGQTVATSYGSDASLETADEIRALELEIDRLEQASVESDPSKSTLALSNAVRHRELGELDRLLLDVKAAVFDSAAVSDPDAELETLRAQLESLRSRARETEAVRVFASGTFSSVVDGYEDISPAELESLTPSGLGRLFSGRSEEISAFGKMIYGTKWYFAAIMDAGDAGRVETGKTASIRFSKTYSGTLDMTVESVSAAEGGRCLAVFSSDRNLADISGLRALTAEVVFSESEGILAPREAVYDDDGTYLYILAGYQAERVNVEILSEYDETYYVVRAAEDYTLRAGTEIITRARDLRHGKVVQ